MKADPAAQRRLLELAQVDADLNRVKHRRRTLAELEEIGRAERELQAKRNELVLAQTSYGDLEREVKRLEKEIEQLRARKERDERMMSSGGSAKQLEELEHELQTLARRQDVLEEELLEVMEQREALEANVTRSKQAVAEAEQALEDAKYRRDEELADLEAAQARRAKERELLINALPAELAALYERILQQRGIAAGPLQGSRCGACRLELDRSTLKDLREAAPDDVVRCSECGAVLVRTGGAGE